MIVRDFNEIVEKERDRVVSDAQWTLGADASGR